VITSRRVLLVGGQIEYRPVSFAPLMVGASYSTQDKLGLEAGAGLMFNHFRIQVTAKNLQSPAMKDGRGLGVAVMTGIDF